jgi:hypothetical protein
MKMGSLVSGTYVRPSADDSGQIEQYDAYITKKDIDAPLHPQVWARVYDHFLPASGLVAA